VYNIKCIVEYDGTFFYGWQIQPNHRTVQMEIEKSLSKMYKQHIKIIGSGRTDTHVHAYGQVFNYKTDKHIPENAILRGLNSLLPDDVVIKSVSLVDSNFNAMCSAVSKTYEYILLNRELPSALYRNYCWHIKYPVKTETLVCYLQKFSGTHDFTSFCKRQSLPDNPVRKVNFVQIKKENDFIKITINANGFLHNMVRNIIGTSLYLYQKKYPANAVETIINAKNREQAGPTAPAHGLYLKEVVY